MAEMMKPPPKHSAAVNMALRGPPSSTQRPSSAADNRERKCPLEDPAEIGQLPIVRRGFGDAESLVIGRLNTLKA